jgi:hypothetical protein
LQGQRFGLKVSIYPSTFPGSYPTSTAPFPISPSAPGIAHAALFLPPTHPEVDPTQRMWAALSGTVTVDASEHAGTLDLNLVETEPDGVTGIQGHVVAVRGPWSCV